MEDILQHDNKIYIEASSTLADQRVRVLKYGEIFGIFDVYGDVKPVGTGAQGIYGGATRFISRLELRVGGRYPTFLSSTITRDDMLFTADLSNSDILQADGSPIRHSTLHLFRSKFLSEDSCHEEIQITNFSNSACELPLSFLFRTDFVDMFEIRGIKRKSRGEILQPQCFSDHVVFRYRGLDEHVRSCRIFFSPPPSKLTDSQAMYFLPLRSQEQAKVFVTVSCFEKEMPDSPPVIFPNAIPRIQAHYQKQSEEGCHVAGSSERFNSWIKRSKSDIALMTTEGPHGPYPYAGIPWFNTIFGRDGIITALQYLWVDPKLARGVLTYLAKFQADHDDPTEDAEPGKILHEFRKGEMVNAGEVPFKRYYGSVDSTPLFVILAGHYLEVTADLPFISSIWPALQSALFWIDQYGDLDGDGFVEYLRRSRNGLDNQGWKDSNDSVSHADGTLAQGPIALCEVQAYVYEAKIQAAKIARRMGNGGAADELQSAAAHLRDKFQQRFWIPEMDCVTLALDGAKHPCNVLSSNAGQCLFTGILDSGQAEKIADRLLSPEMFSGWGIRTLSMNENRYNPMSYHNGSIWPHDNSLIAEGFARYHLKDEVLLLAETLFDVATHVDLYRLPELFCGFPRRSGQGPTLYPVACSPQAWAAGSAFMLLKACLGLTIHGFDNMLQFRHPVLPSFIHELRLRGLSVGSSKADILLRRHGQEVSVYVEKREGKLEVNILK